MSEAREDGLAGEEPMQSNSRPPSPLRTRWFLPITLAKAAAAGLALASASGCGARGEDQVPARAQQTCALDVDRIEVAVGPRLRTNCYVLSDPSSKQVLVIDPGAEPERIEAFVAAKGYQVEGIVLTHAHPDHVGGAAELQTATGAPIHVHPAQIPNAELFGDSLAGLRTDPVADGARLQVGCSLLECLHTPGHSPGSITLHSEHAKLAFTGDLLFAGSIGRTDLPGGDRGEIIRQVKRLVTSLPPDTRVLPGHGDETTILAEKTHNPFVRQPRP